MSSNHSNKSPSAATVVFLPSGRRGRFPTGITLLEAARQLGEPIESICGGHVACGKCQVRIETGKFPKLGIESDQSHVTPLTDKEKEWLKIAKADAQGLGQLRLSCNARLLNDVVVFVPEHARTHQQTIRKDATMRPVAVKPAIRQVYVELEAPSLGDRRGDWERLKEGLLKQWDFENLTIAYPALRTLSQAMREGKWKVMVVLWKESRVIEVRPGYQKGIWGAWMSVTQNDVRAIQLAKAALYAGSKPLMRKGDVDFVDRIVLAGAFSSYIDPFHPVGRCKTRISDSLFAGCRTIFRAHLHYCGKTDFFPSIFFQVSNQNGRNHR